MRRLLALCLASCSTLPAPPAGEKISVPCNQVLTPAGLQVEFPGRPTDLAFSPDGKVLAVLGHRTITFVDPAAGVVKQRIDSKGKEGYGFRGIRFHGGRLYASNLSGRIDVFEPATEGWKMVDPIELTRKPSGPGGLAFTDDRIFVVMNTQNELWELDLAGKILRKLPVGVAPYDVIVSGKRAFVSNWGGRRPEKDDPSGPAGVGRVRVDGRHIASEGSVSVIELETGRTTEIVVGPHASGLLLEGTKLHVACAAADRVETIDVEKLAVVAKLDVRPREGMPFGSAPNALAALDGRLLVSNGTNNAVAIARDGRVEGFVPVGWYPAGLAVHGRRIAVANIKGVGSRDKRRDKGWNVHDYRGSVSIFEPPADLEALTKQVHENNRTTEILSALGPPRKDVPPRPVPERHGEPSLFEHVIYIIKENRTYDQILGDMREGDGDPALCEFPEEITPNHHAIAREFVLMDRFFCSGALSADGHQWTNEAYVTDYVEKFFGGWVRSYPYSGGDALAYAPSGFLWDNALARGKSLRVYGEFVEATIAFRDGTKRAPTYRECLDDYRTGANRIEIRATARIKTLEPYICPTAIGFPLTVTDQHRADQFIRELEEGKLANLSILLLPADHTAGTKPGMPTPKSCVADNDLALGRIVEAVSKSKYWPRTCIFVVEDDPQAGFDHVDGHRTVSFVISPYTKRRAVVHTEYNQTSLVRTIELLLGLPPMNQLDASATPMRDCFTDKPDLTPYKCRPARVRIDETNARLEDIRDPEQRKWAEKSERLALDDVDEADEDTLNRIVWHAMKGWRTPYPERYALRTED